ncbi:hypothetical protein QCA50_005195 [Cerrena zonata]|uniref:Cytochrome P450 n=1 Tax=Cerrena zonata TaxID=2478898 RepID=A0AAW0GGQ4_9APHY
MFFKIALLGLCTHQVLRRREPESITHAFLTIAPGALGSLYFATSLTPWTMTIAVTAYLVMLCLWVILYRLSPLHPLAEYPGPLLNKVTQLAPMWTVYTGRQHLVNHALHAKYGPIVRIGPNDISVVDVTAIASVLGGNGLPKGRYYRARQIPNAPHNIIGMYGQAHAARRKLWNRGFTPESLLSYEEHIAKHASTVVEKLRESNGQDIDLIRCYGRYDVCFRFILTLSSNNMSSRFGKSFNMLAAGDQNGIWDTLGKFAMQGAIASHVPWARTVFLALPMFSKYFMKMRNFGMGCAMQRLKSEAKVKDLWYYLSDEAGLEKTKPSVGEVGADGTFAVVAGADTTASALSSLFWFLLRDLAIYDRVQKEIDSVYVDGANPLSTARHGQLVFLSACINETLRLHPPLPTNGPRHVPEDAGGKSIAGKYIPSGTQVYLPPFSLHRDPRYFSPSPDTFIPDRWLTSNPEESPAQSAFIPFSYGPANCVGRQMAKQEMLMFASLLLQNFDFAFAPQFKGEGADAWEGKRFDFLVTTRAPLIVRVKPRA